MAETVVPEALVETALEQLLSWPGLARSPQLAKFLDYIVRARLHGDEASIKAYSIAVDVFGRPQSFDPQSDPIVRVQARRLRTRLARYYRDEGNSDELIVDLPKGGYAPVFRARDDVPASKRSLTATLVGRNTVAVLPLADDSPGASLDYFCRGLRDEIVHALTSIKALRVLAVRRDETDGHPANREAAALLITGGVRSARDRLRVTIHLVDGASGYYL